MLDRTTVMLLALTHVFAISAVSLGVYGAMISPGVMAISTLVFALFAYAWAWGSVFFVLNTAFENVKRESQRRRSYDQ